MLFAITLKLTKQLQQGFLRGRSQLFHFFLCLVPGSVLVWINEKMLNTLWMAESLVSSFSCKNNKHASPLGQQAWSSYSHIFVAFHQSPESLGWIAPWCPQYPFPNLILFLLFLPPLGRFFRPGRRKCSLLQPSGVPLEGWKLHRLHQRLYFVSSHE